MTEAGARPAAMPEGNHTLEDPGHWQGKNPTPTRRPFPLASLLVKLGCTALIIAGAAALLIGQALEIRGRGIPSLPGVLFDLAAGTGLLALCASLGAVLIGRWILEGDIGQGMWLGYCTALGAGLLSLCVLALGMLGILQPLVLGGMLSFLLLSSIRAVPRVARALRGALVELNRRAAEEDLRLLPALCGLVVLPFLLLALLPPTDWDSLMYHLDIPMEWLRASRILLPADNYHFIYVGLNQFLYLPLLAVKATSAPAILNLGFAALLGLSLFDLAGRFVGGRTALLSLVALLSSTSILLVASTARVDSTLALLLLLAGAALEKALDATAQLRWQTLAGVLLGCAIGTKWSALAFLPGMLGIYLWSRWRAERSLRSLSVQLLWISSLLAMLALPWLLKNAAFVGPPLYPMGAERRSEPWIAQAYGSRDVPAGVDPVAFTQLSQARQGFNLFDFFFRPGHLTIEAEGRWYFPSLLMLGIPALAFLRRRPTVLRWLFSSSAFCALALGVRASTNLRYLIPALPGFCLAAAYALSELGEHLRPAAFRRRTILTLASLTLVLTGIAGVVRLAGSSHSLPFLLGREDAARYLTDSGSPLGELGPLLERVNVQLSSNARVLMLFEARGLYFRPRTLQDNRLTNWPLLAVHLAGDTCLHRTGVTHVLVNEAALHYYVERGMDPAVLAWDAFDGFRAACLKEVDRSGSHTLYEVRQATP